MSALRTIVLCFVWVLGSGAADLAWGQASLQVPLQFDFLNPGARSLALGSAFTGLADDATAAFTNPAGLTTLTRPEISFEGRVRWITTPFLDRGRLSGRLTNQLDDVVNGPVYSDSSATTGSPSFFSIVYPRPRWAISGYRHEAVKLRDSFQAHGTFQDTVIAGNAIPIRERPLGAERNMNLVSYGVSGAFRVNNRVTLGAGVSLQDFSLESTFARYDTVGGAAFGAPDFSRELFRTTQTGDALGVGVTAGIQYSPNTKVRVGAAFRSGANFEVELQEAISNTVRNGTFRAPNAFSTGIIFRPKEVLTLTVDYAFVGYTSLKSDYIDIQTTVRSENFTIQDGHEVHGGVEYVFTNMRALPALRFGAWFDPDHAVTYQVSPANDTFDERFAALLPGGEDLVHFTMGLGLAFNPGIELNVAGDLTSKRKTFSSSIIYRFAMR